MIYHVTQVLRGDRPPVRRGEADRAIMDLAVVCGAAVSLAPAPPPPQRDVCRTSTAHGARRAAAVLARGRGCSAGVSGARAGAGGVGAHGGVRSGGRRGRGRAGRADY